VVPVPSLVPETELAEDDDPIWPSARIGVVEALWGEGFLFPGGREETLRLATPLGLSAASSLLLLGAGSGGPGRSITTELGSWVSGYEANANLAALANERTQRAGLGRRAEVEIWNPSEPKFPQHYYHHAIAIEPLHGAPSEPTLGAVSLALKQGGQFVLMEIVADRPLDPDDAMVATWTRLDHRPADVPSELAITKTLGHLGFDVRIAEDTSTRDMRYAIRGWREAVRAMQGARPTLHQTALIVREAELWLARVRLMRAGKLRLVRWHAIGRG
jgi:cyclopropane fatty-acyl-phospholipid synthase-like methyltransferase